MFAETFLHIIIISYEGVSAESCDLTTSMLQLDQNLRVPSLQATRIVCVNRIFLCGRARGGGGGACKVKLTGKNSNFRNLGGV